MDARQVQYFLAVVDHGGVTRAAQALHIAQPSISQSLRALERELDVELFHRVGRGMELSDAGRAFLEPARRVAADLTAAMDEVRRTATLRGGRLELAVTEDLSIDPLVGYLAAFRAAHPDVRVHVHRAPESEQAARMIREAGCEVALCALPDPYPGLTSVRLGARHLVLVVPRHLATTAIDLPDGAVPLPLVAQLPLVVGSVGDLTRTLLEARLRAIGTRLRATVEANVSGAVARLVEAGAGAGLLPVALAQQIAAAGRGVVHEVEPALTIPVGIIHRTDSLSAASREFVRIATGVP